MDKRSRLLAGLFAVLFLGFVFTIRDVLEQRVVEAGETAPKFAITTESGQRITQNEFGGKLLLVNFWATWCPPCVQEMPSLNQFARNMAPSGVVVLGVSIDRNERAYKTFLQRNQLGFPLTRDPDETVSSSFGTFKWPESYLIDRSGKVVQKFVGMRDWNDPQIVSSIQSLL